MSEQLPRAGLGRGQGRKSGPAALRISASGHASLSARAMDALGWPRRILIAAKDGALIVKVGSDDDHRAYHLIWATEPTTGVRSNTRFNARSAFTAAGMLPESGSARYLALECDSEDGRAALYIRKDQQVAVEYRGRRTLAPEAVDA